MEPQTPPPPPPDQKPAAMANYNRYSSTVDTSSPFSSVKEAVAIFGEKFLVAEIYSSPSPKPFSPSININPKEEYSSPPWKFTPSPMKKSSSTATDEQQATLVEETLKRLESELQETKMELKLLKERGSETEIQLASLNAELHKNMSKLAQAEAAEAAAAKAEAKARTTNSISNSTATLDQILSIGEEEGLFGGINKGERRKMMRKKKPIVPLVTDLLFSWKKRSSSSSAADDHLRSSLFPSAHHVYLN